MYFYLLFVLHGSTTSHQQLAAICGLDTFQSFSTGSNDSTHKVELEEEKKKSCFQVYTRYCTITAETRHNREKFRYSTVSDSLISYADWNYCSVWTVTWNTSEPVLGNKTIHRAFNVVPVIVS